jgi:hypothetical protein
MVAAAVALSAAGSVQAIQGEGLIPPSEAPWPRWQARLSLGTVTPLLRDDPMNPDVPGLRLNSATLLGDYYFARSKPRLGDSGGFRATSGVFFGSRSSVLLSTGGGSGTAGRTFSVDRRNIGGFSLSSTSVDAAQDNGAVPYVGVGYTGLSSRSGWGFSADFGLMALQPGSAVKLGRVVSGNQSLDDVLRDMRLSPLLQLGVSYSF